ncbi:hypothetical protein LCGC14_0889140 [marine sediment metagenome]|uniref:Uncharacterized protein n=1 Tax=marine sediment metagenome TaxID=412755 RepID=A0A0F9S6R9_9ZZZZ|nr:hypothetical protein [bacterium]
MQKNQNKSKGNIKSKAELVKEMKEIPESPQYTLLKSVESNLDQKITQSLNFIKGARIELQLIRGMMRDYE